MARSFVMPNVGARGRRRIVPMMGIDFIAGQIERKGSPVAKRSLSGDVVFKPYGQKPPSIGGRTRAWSFINFLNVDANMGRSTDVSQAELQARENFRICTLSALATVQSLQVLAQVNADFADGKIYGGVSANDYATPRGWVMALRKAALDEGIAITPEYTVWPPVFQ